MKVPVHWQDLMYSLAVWHRHETICGAIAELLTTTATTKTHHPYHRMTKTSISIMLWTRELKQRVGMVMKIEHSAFQSSPVARLLVRHRDNLRELAPSRTHYSFQRPPHLQ
jgi:hypothetical protein